MEKVDFAFPLNEEQQKLKETTYNVLCKQSMIKAWLKEHQLNNDFLYQHTGKFKDWLEQREKCEHCQGLKFCRQPMQGHVMDIAYDGVLFDNVLRRCQYFVSKEQQLAHKKYYRHCDLAEDQLMISLMNIDTQQENKEYKAVLNRLLDKLMDESIRKGAYLWGKPGSGKTYLAAGITNYYAKKHIPCAFVSVPKLIANMKLMFSDNSAMDQLLRRLKQVDVLVLDDIGGEGVSAWSRDDILLPLLDIRMEAHKRTYFTSNYKPTELKERLALTSNNIKEPMAAERLIERICTLADIEFVKGESRRK